MECQPCEPSFSSSRPRSCWSCALKERLPLLPSPPHILSSPPPPRLSALLSLLSLPLLLVLLVTGYIPVAEAARPPALAPVSPSTPFPALSSLLLTICALALSKLVWNTASLSTQQLDGGPALDPPSACDAQELSRISQLLSAAIRIKTVSHDPLNPDGQITDTSKLLEMHALLQREFPLVHSHLKREVVNEFSLLFEWTGSAASEHPPVMLCAHLDVVPAPHEPSNPWTYPPFEGVIDEQGVVWGRGAIDNKHNVLMQLDAVEQMLQRGERPRATVFLAYGHDEEIGGHDGARHLAKLLSERLNGRQLGFILDEGPFLVRNAIPGVSKPIAFIGDTEKGAVTAKLTVAHRPSGHSSQPHPAGGSNVGVLARAVCRLEQRAHPTYVDSYIRTLLHVGYDLPLALRAIVANAWLFKPLLRAVALRKASTAATIRTTTAVTLLRAGAKINAIPGEAYAWIDHRIHPEDRDEHVVLARDAAIINDPRVSIAISENSVTLPPAPVSSLDSEAFKLLKRVIRANFNEPPIAPLIMIGLTDTRHYWALSPHIYRFTPCEMDIADLSMFHGVNERISATNLAKLRTFYDLLLCQL
ncbi:MAG: hypothetical protein SGPRY_006761 [Prymnesium sp.]